MIQATRVAILVLLALVATTLLAVAIDVRTGVSVASFGWLYLLVILPVTLRWGRVAGILTAVASLLLLLTFLTEPRGLPYTRNGVDLLRLLISTGGVAIAVFLVDQANHRLASRDRLLASLVKSASDAVIGESLDGTIVSWSPGAQRLYGFSAEEALGRQAALLTPPDRAGEAAKLVARLNQGERIAHHETQRLTRDGRTLDVMLSLSPIRDANGAIAGVSTIARDVTARKILESALQANADALGSAIERVADGLILFDDQGRVLLANHHAQALMQSLHQAEAGVRFGDLFGAPLALHPPVRWQAIAAAPASTFLAVDTSGSLLWLRVGVTRVIVEHSFLPALFALTLRDATEEVEDAYQQHVWRTQPLDGRARGPDAALPALPVMAADNPSAAAGIAALSLHQGLTAREGEVLALIAGGRSNQQIADELGITVNTVERHTANVYRKLHIRSRVQAAAYALTHGLASQASTGD